MKARVFILALVWANTLAMSSAENEPKLPASTVALATSIKESASVMVCRLVDLGWVDFWGPGENGYDSALFEVRAQLKGASSPRVVCSFRVKTLSSGQSEEAPEIGKDYIIVGSPTAKVFVIQKLAAATPSNIAEVNRLLGNNSSNEMRPPASTPGATPPPAPLPSATTSASPQPATPLALTPVAAIEHKSLVWPWLVGVLALVVIGALVFKRRA